MDKMLKCSVYGCLNNITHSDPSIQFYFFPKHPVVAQQWANACCVWRSDEIDMNTARICSEHFDADSYTSEYKMVDYLGIYTKVLKYDAIPTLYLPQPTIAVIKSSMEEATSTEMKHIIVYGVENPQDQNFNPTFPSNAIIIDNPEPQIETPISKYEELKSVALSVSSQSNHPDEKTEVPNEPAEYDEKYQLYKSVVSYRQLNNLKQENDKLKKELAKLEQSIDLCKQKVKDKVDLYRKKDLEYSKLLKLYNSLERKSMSIGDQKNLLSKVFSESQIKILSGKKKIYWSNDDMAIGYTIRHMSSKRCYMYLSKNLNIPLPALSSIKRWQTLKKGEFVKEEKMKVEKDDKNEESDE